MTAQVKNYTVAEQWEEYAKLVVPADAGAVQRQETRRAFYAGCESILTTLSEMTARPEISEDAGVAMVEGLIEECRLFAQEVRAGRA